jgi:hypothetical protein
VLSGFDASDLSSPEAPSVVAVSGIIAGLLFRGVDRRRRIRSGRLTARIVGQWPKKIGECSGLDPQSCAAHWLRHRLCDVSRASEQI